MGIYIFTMRAKTVSIILSPVEKVKANLYSYAYRYSSLWRGDYGYKSYTLTESNAARNACATFAKPRSGYIVMGDLGDGKLDLEGSSVYKDVTNPVWYDTDKFPGTLVGYLAARGNQLILSDRTAWSKGTKTLRGDTWVPIRTRMVMVDGKATYESEDLPCNQESAIS